MSQNLDIFIEGEGKETLTQNHYKACGGEGTVYQKGGTAFKIMLPGHKVIERKKLAELNRIQSPNVLVPLKYILDSKGKPVGFTMKYVHNTESLCKLFNFGFKQRNGISPGDIVDLVKEMQTTLQKIHDAKILVVDFNQMNFLVDGKKFKTPYFIDTDSYQTPSFKATAIMECIRDRSVRRGDFSEFTDWFSWGVVTFWLYIGTHPFRGGHPNYNLNDWHGKRMDDNISVFNKDVTMPPNCMPLSVIPKSHLEWYKEVFANKGRSIPPLPDGNVVVAAGITVKDVADFIVKKLFEYDSQIRFITSDHDLRYVVTNGKVWKDKTPVFSCDFKYDFVGLSKVVDGDIPVLVTVKDGNMVFYDWSEKKTIDEIEVEKIMFYKGSVYSQSGNRLIEHTCTKLYGKIIHSVREISNIFGQACDFFDGVVVQDIVGKAWLLVPNDAKTFFNVYIKELDGCRIADAKFSGDTCVVIAEKKGKVQRYVITFSKSREHYSLRTTDSEIGESADFIVKSTGVCVAPINGGDLETWAGNQRKIFKKSPIPMGSMLYNENNVSMFAVDNKLYVVEKK